MAQQRPYLCLQLSNGRTQRRWSPSLLRDGQWKSTRHQTPAKTREIHDRHKEKCILLWAHFSSRDSTQRGLGIFSTGDQGLDWTRPRATCSDFKVKSSLCRRLGQVKSRGFSQSKLFWFASLTHWAHSSGPWLWWRWFWKGAVTI